MRRANQKQFVIMALLTMILLGCNGVNPTPAKLEANVESPVQQPTQPASPPSPTSAVFVMRPTFTPAPTGTPFSLETSHVESFGPSQFPEGMNPLTGLMVEDPNVLERRPMAIKVTNFPRSVRPQWGLSKADHIYEYYLEDGLTRFVGIFYGQDASRVGPIRSGRPFDYYLVTMYKAIFAFGYADRKVYDAFMETEIKNLLVIERPGNCPPMCRIDTSSKSDYNNMYTDTKELSQYITDRGTSNGRQNLDGLSFSERLSYGGGNANTVAIRYSGTSYHLWEYNPAEKFYVRSQEIGNESIGEEEYAPLHDSLTNQWLHADNLVILLVPTGYFYKSNSTEIYNIKLVGQGRAYVLRNGKIFDVVWHRPDTDTLISLKFPNGNSFQLKPGNVWFEVLSDLSTHETKPGGAWQFYFDLPDDE